MPPAVREKGGKCRGAGVVVAASLVVVSCFWPRGTGGTGRDHWRRCLHQPAKGTPPSSSIRSLSRHMQVCIEKLQRSTANVVVQLRPIHTGGIDAGLRIVVQSRLIAFIVEDLVVDRSRQYVESSVWY